MRRFVVSLTILTAVLVAAVPAHAADPVWVTGHVQNQGWGDPSPDFIGTTGQSLRLEAIQLVDPVADVQGHVQNQGWGDWTQVGVVGTTGQSLQLEAIRIKGRFGNEIMCMAHVQNIGWMDAVGDGEVCGTTGQSLRLEAIRLWSVPATPPAPTEPVLSTVATVGDVGLEAAGLDTLTAMGAADASLTFLLGDLSYGTAAQPFCDAVTARIPGPFGWVQGNHETVPDSDGPLTADFLACLPATPDATGTPAVEQVIEIPGARIITASPQENVGYLPGTPGYQRISDAIDAANTAGVWPILAMHEPHITVGLHGSAGPESQALTDLAIAKGVPLILTSHDHNYSRTIVGGSTFIVAGMGGHNVRGLDLSSPWWPLTVAAYPGDPGFLSLTIREHSITGQIIGGGADTFEITRAGGV